MPNTTNFNWATPADTDLVKDGAAAIRTLGSSIDTSLVDLKGGTTGQILSKTSNTDLDYTWINNDQGDITEVQAGTGISVASGTGPIPVVTNTVATAFDAKGDLVVGTGADTFARLGPVGANDTVLTADSSTATGLKWAAPASGGMTLLSTTSLSGTTTSITSISGSYNNLFILVSGYKSTTQNDHLYMAVNGSTTAGTWSYIYSGAASGSGNASKLKLTAAAIGSTGTDSNWMVDVANYASTSNQKVFSVNGLFYSNGDNRYDAMFGTGAYLSTSAITSLTFSCDGSGMTGTVRIYGVK